VNGDEIYGLIAEFDDKEKIVEATRHARDEGYRRMDAYTPFPVPELPFLLGRRGTAVPLITLIGGMIWGLGGYFMEWYSMGVDYPVNVGGRPFNSWPNFIPVTFELTVLGAALSAVIAMLALNRLPQPYHPVFDAPNFHRASVDRFFLCIQSDDPKFDLEKTHKFLETLKPLNIAEVPMET
jgi:Protein of unknown function (DUF3341)